MERVRMGIIGFGCRAYGMMDILMGFEDVDITAVCDKYEDRRDNAKNRVIERLSGKQSRLTATIPSLTTGVLFILISILPHRAAIKYFYRLLSQ